MVNNTVKVGDGLGKSLAINADGSINTVSSGGASGLTDTQLRATPVPISGTVTGAFFQATQPVSGTFWQATQPVSISGSLAVTGPLTDAQLRASAVSVFGTLRINSNYTTHFVPGSANGVMLGAQDVNEYSELQFSLTNTFVASVSIQMSIDNFWWFPARIYSNVGAAPSETVSEVGLYHVPLSGRYFQVTISNYVSGTVNFTSFVPAIPKLRQIYATPTSASTAAVTSVAASITSVTLLSANTRRRGAMVFNDSTSIMYLKYGTTASTTDFTVKLGPDALYEISQADYSGRIDAIWASATGSARITEVT